MGSTNTGSSVLDRLVGYTELSQVVANHFRLDFNKVESLAVVDSHNRSNHLRNDDHVTEVGLHHIRLLIGLSFLLGLAQLLHKGHWLALQTTGKPPPGTSVHQLHQLFSWHIQELVQVDTSEGELPEGPLLLLSIIDPAIATGEHNLPWPQVNIIMGTIPSARLQLNRPKKMHQATAIGKFKAGKAQVHN